MGRLVRPASEVTLIDRIVRELGRRAAAPRDLSGPGDDAAVLGVRQGMHWVVSCDWFSEQTHFLPAIHPPEAVGYKALARASSDLAAMGASPRYFLLALALPPARTGRWLDQMLAGMRHAARRLGVTLIGGDTSAQRTVSLTITVIGEVPPGRAISRSGARPGHRLFVSGKLGEARLGLELLRRGDRRRRFAAPFLRRHFYPQPRIALGQWLARNRLPSAMIDVSDGLSTDLRNLCRASGVGARLLSTRIPRVAVPPTLSLDSLRLALDGGDDYELLFAVPPRLAHRIPARFQGLRLSCIGEITRRKALLLETPAGTCRLIRPQGWDPFRGK